MKTKFIIICGLLALATLTTARPAEEEYEYEEEPAPPPKKTARPLVGRRNPLAGKTANKASSTTSTTTAAPQEAAEEPVEGDYVDEQQPDTSSTTESSKKFLKTGVVRPFRSNDDLLATLKRRREQAIINKHNKPVASESKDDTLADEPVPKESKPAASTAAGRRNRFSKPASKATAKADEVPAAEETSSSPASGRTARGRFSARS